MEKLLLVGWGPGDESLCTDRAREALEGAQRTLNTREMPLSVLLSELKKDIKGKTVVLVSGDSGFFSAAKMIIKEFSGLYEIALVPGIGSIPYFSAKIKISYDDALLTSLHGRSENIVAKAAYNKKIFALTGGANDVGAVCAALCRYGLGGLAVWVGERLSFPDERIVTGTAERLKGADFDSLSVMYIENPAAVNPHGPLGDGDFIRSGVPMTKEEIRWLSIQKLGIAPRDTVFDIGAGTGSVSVEMARKAFDGFVYAVEAKADACALIKKNAAKHGAFNMETVHGEAPDALDGLPIPDKAFIGGSAGRMDGILRKLTALNPQIKVTASAITLQTLHQITEGFERYGLTDTEIICVNIAKSKRPEGRAYDMMTAQNPVYLITGTGAGGACG